MRKRLPRAALRRSLRRIQLAGVFLFFAAAFYACSRTEPKIPYGFIELVYYQSQGKPDERFSFFIIADDDDGIENLDELYLYHDREQLRWQIKSSDWVSFTQDGKTWIGSRSIALEGDESLPRGQFRAVLVNKGGEKTERVFSFDAPDEIRYPFPALHIAEGKYTADSTWPQNRLICYDGQGNYVSTIQVDALSGAVSALGIPSSARTAALWAEDPLYATSALTDVAPLR